MPEKEKVKDVQALADTLDSLPETVKQRILGVAEGYQLAIDASSVCPLRCWSTATCWPASRSLPLRRCWRGRWKVETK